MADAAIAKVFVEIHRKNSISLIVWTPRRVQEVESYALSKFQPPTTLGDSQKIENNIRKKYTLFLVWEIVVSLRSVDFGGGIGP